MRLGEAAGPFRRARRGLPVRSLHLRLARPQTPRRCETVGAGVRVLRWFASLSCIDR